MIDLHLHLDGSIPYRTIIKLAKMNDITVPDDMSKLKRTVTVPKTCERLSDYLNCFSLPVKLLQNYESIYTATYELCLNLKQSGMLYTEIRFAPAKHTFFDLSQEDVVETALKAVEKSGFNARLILCCMREKNNKKENLLTVNTAGKFLNKGVVGLDLEGDEKAFKTKEYEYVFKRANELGIPYTIHSGEADGKDSMLSAINFGAKRIGHGIQAIYSSEVTEKLIKKNIPLEVCISSNVQTKTVASLNMHPVKKLFDKGVLITINSDNMTVSDTDVFKEFKIAQKNFGLEPKLLLKNAVNSAFCDQDLKKYLLKKIGV